MQDNFKNEMADPTTETAFQKVPQNGRSYFAW